MKLWYTLNENNRIENWTIIPHNDFDVIDIVDISQITKTTGIIDGQLVDIPLSESEINEMVGNEHQKELRLLRSRREAECFSIINRGQLWYSTLTGEQLAELNNWYQEWLMVTETMNVPIKPEWLV